MIVQRVRSPHCVFRQLAVTVLVWLLILPPATLRAGSRKGDKLRNQARAAEVKGDFDRALDLAKQALDTDPADPAYELSVRRIQFEDGMMHVGVAHRLRDAGHLQEALAEFEKALAIDPAIDIAAQEIKRTKEMIERAKTGVLAPPPQITPEDEKTLTPVQLARKESEIRTSELLPVPQLKPLNPELIDLKMTNRPRILFETVGKVAGINVLFDPDYDTQQTIRTVPVELSRTTLEQALNYLAVVTRSYWKPLSPNTIFVTIDNPQKRRDYAEQVVKVFYLSNLTAPTEMNEILTVLRTVLDAAKVFQYTAQNAVIVRTDADTMALVDKIIASLDKPRPEVVVDVMVMEVSSTYIRNLSAAFAGTGINTSAVFAPRPGITTPGLQSATSTSSTTSSTTTTGTTTTTTPTTTTGTTGTTGSTSVTEVPLSALGHISSADFSITTLPGATFEAVLNDSSTRLLQAPQIRAVSNTKAELKIGEKVPTASGSFQPGVAGVGVSPLVNTQFTYLDVGVNVTLQPQVMDNDEVAMHMDLDISQVNNYQNLGGISEPVIGQNKLTTDIRLKQGEVNLIGGIIQQTDSKATTGIPGLANLPVIGHFFNDQNLEKDRTELVIALIPHIVRGSSIDADDLKGVASGSIGQIKVSLAPRVQVPAEQPQGAPVTTPAAQPPGAPPATAPPATAPPVTAPPVTAPVTNQGPAQPSGPARVRFNPPAITTTVGSTITVTLAGDNINDMASAAAQLRYDPRILRINSISAGDLPVRNIAPPPLTQNILNDTGQADMSISRGPQGGGISGGGGLFTVVFQVTGRGTTNVSVSSLSLTTSAGRPINSVPPSPLQVTVN